MNLVILFDRAQSASAPARRVTLYSPQQEDHRNCSSGNHPKRTVLIHSDKDMNPLRPCGGCNKWLKKIVESNPYFPVPTFSDS